MIGNRPAKIEADKSGVNLLFHILAFFGVEMKQVERIFRKRRLWRRIDAKNPRLKVSRGTGSE